MASSKGSSGNLKWLDALISEHNGDPAPAGEGWVSLDEITDRFQGRNREAVRSLMNRQVSAGTHEHQTFRNPRNHRKTSFYREKPKA